MQIAYFSKMPVVVTRGLSFLDLEVSDLPPKGKELTSHCCLPSDFNNLPCGSWTQWFAFIISLFSKCDSQIFLEDSIGVFQGRILHSHPSFLFVFIPITSLFILLLLISKSFCRFELVQRHYNEHESILFIAPKWCIVPKSTRVVFPL